ncbi:hypothetical protein A3D66_03230 [Candidatus Kaiserbacteria bacterium RIFCSPHIGHO2_02_FULL_50_9]|uniref:Fibronectin type-III domain-containing protein n=1 Tax=Candidatus Kaiserbacteria bacterium RIFCSPLOWO2_01_FULL_51_21 TaxID=1798508 RepID=A0A1F6ECE1_9BACT|nr:MAG: hypothetical protein A2761_02985 [Candidatus Kaiserbacteria bacterium RIFCSPHIGHO2_01_FULL_51_33]OGG63574.1 MAG: hypothetical protein A3D66_03230 [Candidatus Kaiserbacteria bacterium RIFCSPHIGHO2_02_FULL_50_9]OGG71338.1 MAG: hypothetical protein A3A35_02275 [Candidatus Kaiserbacteria bacterium RIFCSPLOWO2_01_FULL_51_21]
MYFTRALRVASFIAVGFLGFFFGILSIDAVDAAEFSASNFRVKDPVITPGGYGTSSSYQLFGTISQIGLGTSTATGFNVLSGFLGFPSVTLPTVSATAGDGSVSLSWSVSSGALGWVVSGYSTGYAATSGGPYTYASIGSTTSATVTGLTNGTTYYFVVLPEDAFGNRIATSSQTSATPVAGTGGTGETSGTGGGGIIVGLFGTTSPFSLPTTAFRRIFRPGVVPREVDLNNDGIADIGDLSILLFYYGRPLAAGRNRADINDDGEVTIADISILFYYWS